ncbi:MAG: hypothetical protein ACK5X3_22515 [Pseudomonadota bacterium]|jgi:hypothetical protein
MKEIFEVFKMTELSYDTRISVILKLGKALDNQYAMNWTHEIVEELVGILKKSKEDEARYREEMAKVKF